jgi:hypothetical protein
MLFLERFSTSKRNELTIRFSSRNNGDYFGF